MDISVEESKFDDLREVRLTDIDEKTRRGDLFLPSLEEYICICKKYKKQAILELKNRMEKAQIWQIGARIKALDWLSNTTFISFSGENLLDLREKYPKANAQYLTGESSEKELQFMIDHHFDADLWHGAVTKKAVEQLHLEGLKVNCWTVDSVKRAQEMMECGVDFITTNILE